MNSKSKLALVVIVLLAGVVAGGNLLTEPEFKNEEGMKMQLARSFADDGVIRARIAPGEYLDEVVLHNISTGWFYPVLLGSTFKIFGSSLVVARVFSLVTLLSFLVAVYFLAHALWGRKVAIFSVLLVASFAPFYAHGKAVMPELLALLCLILGVYFYLKHEHQDSARYAILPGILIGLFVATKPTFLLFFLPPLFVAHVVEALKRSDTRKWLVTFWISVTLMILPTLWLAVLHPIGTDSLRETLAQYSKPAEGPCVICTPDNIQTFVLHSSVFHVALLFVVGLAALLFDLWRNKFITSQLPLKITFAFFSLGTVWYYLGRTGNFRYLLPLQLILLFVLPAAMTSLPSHFRRFGSALCVVLILVQGIHMFAFADTPIGDPYVQLEQFMQQHISSGDSLGVINAPIAVAIAPTRHVYQFIWNAENGIPEGVHALSLPVSTLPNYLIFDPVRDVTESLDPYADVLADNYKVVADFEGRVVVMKKIGEGP